MKATIVFNGQSALLKCFLEGAEHLGKPSGLLHQIACHDVGVGDAYVTAGEDEYGHLCKCPPGEYPVGVPIPCATRNADGSVVQHNDDDAAYGCWFVPLYDDSAGDFAKHGREGIAIHGGGSDLAQPFALHQGWEHTHGCLRVQNVDLEQTLVPFVQWCHRNGVTPTCKVVWP